MWGATMLTLDRFEIESVLSVEADHELYVARDEQDGSPVLLKALIGEPPDSLDVRARREIELLTELAGPGVPRVREWIEDPIKPLLVFDLCPGKSLRDLVSAGPLDPAKLVELGHGLASALAGIHARRLLHLGLDPSLIWVSTRGLSVQPLDFDWVRPLSGRSQEVHQGRPPLPRVYGLAFISPERTGRMGRGVDARSDLYSLGACLYFAATGSPPFESDDALALVHAHLAKPPPVAVEVRPTLPSTLSRIISRLLQKAPESRYQVAAALQTDFAECRAQLARTGSIANDLMLATADAPYRPLFSKQLYGRDDEQRVLHRALALAQSGGASSVLLSGVAGAGKSSLVDALRQLVTHSAGYLAQGKFDLYRLDVPYSGLSAALGNLVQQLLTESDDRLAAWDAKLRSVLGGLAGALVGIVPDIELVLPRLPPAERVAPDQALARISLAVQRLLASVADSRHPLVLFIDDLQWADAASREVLRSLLTQGGIGSFVFIGALRSEEVTEQHPLHAWIEQVAAGPLPFDRLTLVPMDTHASSRMLADALGRKPEDTSALADVIARKTANNPLLIQQFVTHLADLGLLELTPGMGWTWDIEQIASVGVVEDAVKLLAARIARLPQEALSVVEIAACVGDTFTAERISSLAEFSPDAVDRALFTLSDEGLIAPCAGGFRFVHDRIREAAQQRIDPEHTARLHHAIAHRLLAETPEDELSEHVFEIADHLSPVLESVLESDPQQIFEIFKLAGERASRSGAALTALRYLETAIQALEAGRVAASDETVVDLYLGAVAACCQLDKYERISGFLEPLRRRPLSPPAAARVAVSRIRVLNMAQTSKGGGRPLPLALAIMRESGVRWPEAPSTRYSWLMIRWTDWLLRGELDESAFVPASGNRMSWLPKVQLLTAATPMLQARASRSACLASAFTLRSFRRYGYVGSPALYLASYSVYRRAVLGHTRDLERYARGALAWAERCPDSTLAQRCLFMVYAFAAPWFEPREHAIQQLDPVCQRMRELGDLEYALYAASQRANLVALSNFTLEQIELEFRSVSERGGRKALPSYDFLAEVCAYLSREIPSPSALEASSREMEELLDEMPARRMACWPFWLLTLCLLGRYDLAHRGAERASSWAFDSAASSAQLADFVLIRGISASEMLHGARRRTRRLRRVVRQSCTLLRTWARESASFEHMHQALSAEQASLARQTTMAIQLYRSALEGALRVGYLHHAAWFGERIAGLLSYERRNFEAGEERRRAAELYERWGATAKSQALPEALSDQTRTD